MEIEFSFPNGLKLLVANQNEKVILTKKQVAILHANTFFHTLYLESPTKNKKGVFPRFSFVSFLNSKSTNKRCVFHYYKRILKEMPTGNLTIERRVLNDSPGWMNSDKKICSVKTHSEKMIEDCNSKAIHVDFANGKKKINF